MSVETINKKAIMSNVPVEIPPAPEMNESPPTTPKNQMIKVDLSRPPPIKRNSREMNSSRYNFDYDYDNNNDSSLTDDSTSETSSSYGSVREILFLRPTST